MMGKLKSRAGFTLMEVIIVSVVMSLVLGGLFISFEYSLRLIGRSRATLSALSLATDRLEYIRSLPYDSVGTVWGIPTGLIPQNRTVSLNGYDFTERVLIEFVDDAADGLGGLDSNGIIRDYKRIKVYYEWSVYGIMSSSSAVSTVVPRSIENNAGGGSLRVNVFDANIIPLVGIDVRLRNTGIPSPVDVTRQTDASGAALFTGAPAGAGYEIFVSETGYSSDQTHIADVALPNPTTLPVAILESDVSTMNFQIDRLSDLDLRFITAETLDEVEETFTNFDGVIASTSVDIMAGELRLKDTAGVYDTSGEVWLQKLAPTTIESWGLMELDRVIPVGTDIRLQFFTSTDTTDILDDADLPGNTLGFSGPYVDLRMVDGLTFPELVPRFTLTTTDTSRTPQISNAKFAFVEATTPANNYLISLRGGKSIGTAADSSVVYKFSESTTTDSKGEVSYNGIEWDEYYIDPNLAGEVVAEVCPSNPFLVNPNTNVNVLVKLKPFSLNNLRVAVKNGAGEPVINAAVTLTRGASVTTLDTSWCGQTFFSGLTNASDYKIDVTAPGYITASIDPVTVDETTVQDIILVAS